MSPQSKYYALREYLRQQPDAVPLELSFAEIEVILGRPLPATAQVTRAWWANSQTAQGRAWQEAGWLVDDVNFAAKLVVFRPARITYRITPIRKSKGWSGEQIKSLREHAGWSQQELANRLQVRQQTISDWEMGHHVARRSMNRLLQMVAEEIDFPYQTDSTEEIDS
jgi:DNA-binding XRE family transcriptional regulator